MVEVLEKAKNSIRQELDAVLKVAAQQYWDENKIFDDTCQTICNVVEAVFIHGLKDAFFLRGSRYSKYPEPNFWPFVSKFTHRSTTTQIQNLKFIRSEIGKARAWIRLVLNEQQLENYVTIISKDVKQLSNFYSKNAFLRDGERIEALLGYLKALSKIPMNAPTNSSLLNTWTPSPLILAGLVSGKPQRVTLLSRITRRNASSSSLTHHDDDAPEEAMNALDLLDEPVNPFDDDDSASVYSHTSMMDMGQPINFSANLRPNYAPFLSSTPENRPLSRIGSEFQLNPPIEVRPVSEIIVTRRKTARIRRNSKADFDDKRTSFSDIPGSSSLPTGMGMLSLQGMLNSKKSAPEFSRLIPGTSQESETGTGSIDSAASSDHFQNDTNGSRSKTRPMVIGSLGNSSALNRHSNGLSLHDELLEASAHGRDSASTVFPGSSSPSSSGPSSFGNSLARAWPSSPSRKESILSNTSGKSLGNTVTLHSALQSVIQHETNLEEINSSTPISSNQMTAQDLETHIDDSTPILLNRESELTLTPVVTTPDDDEEPIIVQVESLYGIDEYGISRNLLDALTLIPVEKGLQCQDYRCVSCRKSVGEPFGKYFTCGLDARYYCLDCYKKGDESIIPARVVLNWDIKPRPIAKASKAFLRSNADRPLISIDKINPNLYRVSKEMKKILKLREQLALTVVYLLTCKQSVCEDFKRRCWPQDYLYTDVHLYSLSDLQNVISGRLEQKILQLLRHAIFHVESCLLCLQKGFICELCNAKKIIYPFQVDVVKRCGGCGAVYHIECFQQIDCPKCQRIAKYTAEKRSDLLPLE